MTENSLRLGEHTFTAAGMLQLLDGVADGITVQDPTGRLIYANPAAARNAGFESGEEMVATPPRELLDAFAVFDETGAPLKTEDLPGRRALAGLTEQERLVRFKILATGVERWNLIKAHPVLDPAGKVLYAVNVSHDVTDQLLHQQDLEQSTVQLEEVTAELESTIDELQQRTAEAEAAQARAEYTAERQRFLAEAGRLLAASLDPESTLRTITHLAVPRIADWCTVSLIDDKGKLNQLEVAHADPAKLRFALELQKKYPPDDEASMRVVRSGESELYPEIPDAMLEQSARDAEHLRIIRELQLRSAMVVPMKIRGDVLGLITFIGAESGRRFDHDDLEFAESLAARSALAITNARLYHQAQEANRSKADFLAIMSHELRTPLTAIFGYTELLSSGITGPITQPQINQLDRIKGSASHLLGIIEDILNYARAEAGHDVVDNDVVTLSAVVEEAASIVKPAAEKKGLSFISDVEKDCVLNTDRGKLRQILVNLLGNAVKFTSEGTIRLMVRCPDDEVVITVEDTGVGIGPADLDKVFEPFRQLQNATTRTAGGTGLGLAVTKRFAELLGGSVAVQSELERGTTFTVRIPSEAAPR